MKEKEIAQNYLSNSKQHACNKYKTNIYSHILFLIIPWIPIISGSTGPIVIKFLPYSRCLVVDYCSDLFDRSMDVAMATNFRGKIGIFAFICGSCIPKRIGASEYRWVR